MYRIFFQQKLSVLRRLYVPGEGGGWRQQLHDEQLLVVFLAIYEDGDVKDEYLGVACCIFLGWLKRLNSPHNLP